MVEIYKLDENENNMEQIQNINNNIKKNKTVVCAVYMPGCHHCSVLKPIWDETMDEMNEMSGQPLDGILASMNMDVPQQLEYEQQPIMGFPHIMALKGGKMITYDKQNRSKESLIEFIKEHLGGKQVGGMKRGRRMRNRSGNKKTKKSKKAGKKAEKKAGKKAGKKSKRKTRKNKKSKKILKT
jgi:thioredoxin-like negative regulator of GroEL